jgi:hypothetical protein
LFQVAAREKADAKNPSEQQWHSNNGKDVSFARHGNPKFTFCNDPDFAHRFINTYWNQTVFTVEPF